MLFNSIFVHIGHCLCTGGIIGVVIGSLIVGIIFGMIITKLYYIYRKRNNQQGQNNLNLQEGPQIENQESTANNGVRKRNGSAT